MNRDPDFLRAEALAPNESLALPDDTAGVVELPGSAHPAMAAEVAVLLGFADGGAIPLVLRTGEAVARHAETLLPLRGEHIGRRVALLPLRGADADWLVIGLLAGQAGWPAGLPVPDGVVQVQADGRCLALQARDELALRCGKASVKLRADGRIEIRGETIVSEAVRANRVRGGSVELN
jgi:hypothetical protein